MSRSIQQFGLVWGLAIVVWLFPADPPAQAQRHHTVRSGDSFSAIARRYRVSAWDLAAANRMKPSDMLRPGQLLTVPSRGVVYVRPGQTLWKIARDRRISVEALARANRMRPNSPLRAGQRLVLPGYRAVGRTRSRDWGEAEQPGTVTIKTRDQKVNLQLRDEEGRVLHGGLETLGRLMQRSDEEESEGDRKVRVPHPRLALVLAAISDHFGGREIHLVSGFREVGGYTRETSRHVDGKATDIRVEGVPKRVLWDYCRSLRHTGCGFYPRSVFVHVDVRESEGQWVDWSRPGRRPWYGTLRGPYGRRVPKHERRRVGRRVTRPEAVPLEVEVVEAADAAELAGSAPASDWHHGVIGASVTTLKPMAGRRPWLW